MYRKYGTQKMQEQFSVMYRKYGTQKMQEQFSVMYRKSVAPPVSSLSYP